MWFSYILNTHTDLEKWSHVLSHTYTVETILKCITWPHLLLLVLGSIHRSESTECVYRETSVRFTFRLKTHTDVFTLNPQKSSWSCDEYTTAVTSVCIHVENEENSSVYKQHLLICVLAQETDEWNRVLTSILKALWPNLQLFNKHQTRC